MGIVVCTSAFSTMNFFVVLFDIIGATMAAPAADADADAYYGGVGLGYAHHGVLAGHHGVLAGHGLAYAAPAAVAHVAPVTVAHAATVAVAHAAPVAVAHAAPVVHHVSTAVAVPTTRVHKTVQTHLVPETRLVGHQVHTQVHHVPQVSVDTRTSSHVTHHVINHPPVVGAGHVLPTGAYAAGHVLPTAAYTAGHVLPAGAYAAGHILGHHGIIAGAIAPAVVATEEAAVAEE